MSRTVVYWLSTGLFTFAMGWGGLADALQTPSMLEGMAALGYPAYFLVVLGTWKLLGVAALLLPGLGRLKEWAYAGFFFSLTGALASHLAVGHPVATTVAPLVLLALGVVSWAARPASRRWDPPMLAALSSA